MAPSANAIDLSRLESTPLSPGRMRRLRSVVVGVGALGNAVVQYLCLAGAAEIRVFDPDTIEPSNLTRSVFFQGSANLGRNKAEAIAHVAGAMFPATQIVPYPIEVAAANLEDLQQAAVWFSCVHSVAARVQIARLSQRLHRPVVDGGLDSDNSGHGRVSWFPPNAACFSCLLSRSRRAAALSNWDSRAGSCSAVIDGTPAPGTPSMAAVVAGLQVELGLRSFFESQTESVSWKIWTDRGLRVETLSHRIAELCPFHWPETQSSACGRDGVIDGAARS